MAAGKDADTQSISNQESTQFSLRMSITPDTQDSSKTPVSVLILTPKWKFDPYGISTITRSLVANLRQIDPDDKYIHITVAVLEEDGKITEEHRLDAKNYHVELRGAKQQKKGKRKKEPELQWMDEYSSVHFGHLTSEVDYDFIIGHVPQYSVRLLKSERNLQEK